MQNQPDEIHAKKKNAKVKLTLRILVALYILYLTKGIVEAAVKHTTSLPLWVTVLASSVFLLTSAAFSIYAWRQYKNALAAPASERGPELSGEDGRSLPDEIDRQ